MHETNLIHSSFASGLNNPSARCAAFAVVLLAFLTHGDSAANAQPGRTPPGSVAPTSPAPAPGPSAPPTTPSQGYYAQPPYEPTPQLQNTSTRSGFVVGASGSLGVMESNRGQLACDNCSSLSGAFGIHAGTMINSKLALEVEFRLQSRDLTASGQQVLTQTMFLLAAQYWLHPIFWVKAGVGASSISLSYGSGSARQQENLDSGIAFHGAIGLEILNSPRYSIDLQLMTGLGQYPMRDETFAVTSAGLGVNWY